MRALLAAASASAFAVAVSLPCQATPGSVLVLVHETAPLRAALHEVDPVSGAVVALPSFPSDAAVPLALAIDPATREPIVAVQAAGGSLLVRVHLAGQQVLGESVLGTVPGTVVGVTVPQVGDLFVATGGAGGGIVRVARQCCGSSTFWTAANVTALSEPVIVPYKFWAASAPSGRARHPPSVHAPGPAPSEPVIVPYKFWAASAPSAGPRIDSFVDATGPSGEAFALPALAGTSITGVHEYLANGTRTRLLADATGAMHRHTLQAGLGPFPVQPPLMAGGAIRVKAGPWPRLYVLGGAADPTLKWLPLGGGSTAAPVTVLAALPPAPVDFAVVAPPAARTVPFGEPCAPASGGRTIAVGVPQLGNGTFLVRLAHGLPSAPALCALGWSERSFLGVPLPLQVGPCALLVSADVVTAHATDMLGTATRPLPVPAVPALGGQIVYAQWGQGFAPLRTSSALALHLFP